MCMVAHENENWCSRTIREQHSRFFQKMTKKNQKTENGCQDCLSRMCLVQSSYLPVWTVLLYTKHRGAPGPVDHEIKYKLHCSLRNPEQNIKMWCYLGQWSYFAKNVNSMVKIPKAIVSGLLASPAVCCSLKFSLAH